MEKCFHYRTAKITPDNMHHGTAAVSFVGSICMAGMVPSTRDHLDSAGSLDDYVLPVFIHLA